MASNDSTRKGTHKFAFAYRYFRKSTQAVIGAIVDRINLQSPNPVHLRSSFFRGRIWCSLSNNWVLLPLFSNTRPPERRLIGISLNTGSHLEPSANYQDYVALASELNIDSEDDAVVFHRLTFGHYAIVDKASFPIRIASEGDANRHGFSLEPKETHLLQNGISLWWEKWGGELHECRFTSSYPLLVVSYDELRSSIGRYKRTPIYVVR